MLNFKPRRLVIWNNNLTEQDLSFQNDNLAAFSQRQNLGITDRDAVYCEFYHNKHFQSTGSAYCLQKVHDLQKGVPSTRTPYVVYSAKPDRADETTLQKLLADRMLGRG